MLHSIFSHSGGVCQRTVFYSFLLHFYREVSAFNVNNFSATPALHQTKHGTLPWTKTMHRNKYLVNSYCANICFWLYIEQVPRGYNDASSSGGWTDGRTDLLGRFKTLSLWLLKWYYYSLWQEIYVFVTFYKSVTDGQTDRRTQPLIGMQGRI